MANRIEKFLPFYVKHVNDNEIFEIYVKLRFRSIKILFFVFALQISSKRKRDYRRLP